MSQDYQPLEYVVIDDGSTDATSSILESYGDRLQWISQTNRGQTATINRGWGMLRGDLLGWLNSDDTLLPDAIETIVTEFESHPEVDVIFGDTLFIDAEGEPLHESPRREAFRYETLALECTNPIPQPSTFIRRRVVEAEGQLDSHYRYFMDWDYWLRVGLHHRIRYVPKLLSTYRLHEASNTVSQTAKVAPELEYMYRKFFERPDLTSDLVSQKRTAMANMFVTTAGYYVKGGDGAGAVRSGLRALRAAPEIVLSPRRWRQLAYCFLGTSFLYREARALRDG